jgi:hypothetical protein
MAEDQTITPKEFVNIPTFGEVTIWQNYRWAQHWFGDAAAEAQRQATGDAIRHARRREILFAVCFAESYLFEWVLDDVLKHDFKALESFFPHDQRGRKRGIREKWKKVTKLLLDMGRIARLPAAGDRQSQAWNTLIEYRDGLVHAVASRPATASRPPDQGPIPEVSELDRLSAGWALGVAREQVRRLHQAAGTEMPSWLNVSF